MTPKQKWLLIFGSGWVGWVDVLNSAHALLFNEIPHDCLEIDRLRQQVRWKPDEPVRVRLAETSRLHPVRSSEGNC
jgi:hypothetical protein